MTPISTDQLTKLIQLLPERQFAALCNDLLAIAAATHGIPRTCLDVTLNTAEPEGGLDARVLDAPVAAGRLIPAGTVGYQYKSGTQRKSAARVAREDIAEKPRVVELLRNGGAFVYLAAWDRASKVEGEIRKEARKLGIDIGADKLVFFTSHTLAQLLQAYPALVVRFFSLDVHLLTLGQWGDYRPLTNPYQVDAAVETQVAELRGMIERGVGPVRLVGSPGDGKTRLVLESLRGSVLAPTVLYSPQREYVTPGLTSYLRSTPDVRCTLVVDEVDDAGAEELNLLFTGMPEGVRLVTIGQDAAAPRSGTVRVQGLSEDLLVEAIRAIATGLDPEVAREIARACHRSPKLAVLIAARVAENPELASPHRILTDGDIQHTLDRYLGVDLDDPAWEALSTFALLQRVGWTEDVEGESEILFRAVGLEPRKARRLVEQIHLRTGIAPRANRFRYISPAILGDYLAARQLGAWPQGEVRTFLQRLPPPMARSFALRVRRMAQVLENRRAVEEVVLGEHGPFRELSDLGQGGFAALLPTFAALFPQAALARLRSLMDDASDAALLAERSARRPLVEALTDLLWRADTFAGAARLLLRLAANENETWGNNATGTWKETFQIHLGRTAAGPDARLRVLRIAAGSTNPEERRLAAVALARAVEAGGHSRIGMPPRDVEGMPEEAWQPATWEEWYSALEAYYSLLGQLVVDPDLSVAIEAAKALRYGTATAIRFPVTEAWVTASRRAIDAPYEVRSELIAGIEERSERHSYLLVVEEDRAKEVAEREGLHDPEIRDAIEERIAELAAVAAELRDDSFSTRLRRAIEHDPYFLHHTDYEEAARVKDDELRALMQEAVADPTLLEGEWTWLAARQGDPGRWAHALGFVDRERRLGERILEQAAEHPVAPRWIAEYEVGYAAGGGGDEWIDRRLAELHARGVGTGIILHLLYRTGVSPFRADLLRQIFDTGRTPGHELSRFVYTDWTQLDASTILGLVEAATASGAPEATAAAIQFLSAVLHRGSSWSEALDDVALRLVRSSIDPAVAYREADDWARVALKVVEQDPHGVAAAAIRQLSHASRQTEDDIRPVLKHAWELSDKRPLFLELVGPAILRLDEVGWQLRARLKQFDVSGLDLEFLAAWIDEDPSTRSVIIAEIVGVPIGTPTDLHAMLLERYEDHGVGGAFLGGLISGVHWGSHADWLEGKREIAQQWIGDPRSAVRAWAENVVQGLDEMIARERQREEEEAVRWL